MTTEPDLSPDVAARRRGLRTGYTTGTCAAAAAKAAAIGLLSGSVPERVEIALPKGTRVSFPVLGSGAVPDGGPAVAAVVKDAGDDPDCTDGAHLTATVTWQLPTRATELVAGDGVGTVTKPGLGIEVGTPSITSVPRRMILAALGEATERPVVATFSVPGGRDMAKKTTNERLGIAGGISILGTTGIVRPFSTAAYRASVVQQIDVAAAQGFASMVLCTGSRSEKAAYGIVGGLDQVQVVEIGDFAGIALRRCVADAMVAVTVVAMAGKIAKYAAGVMMTHFHRSEVDTGLLARVATETGAPPAVVAAAAETATARHFFDACIAADARAPLERLCAIAADQCRAHTGGMLAVDVVMVDFEGEQVVARG
ncbi:MAG: cobalt-precorrin-5B (C(1))-methyltransferase [Acidimicrobiales bacterium]